MSLHEKLSHLNIHLPPVSGPFGAYIPIKRHDNLLYVAGQLPMKDGKLLATGPVPSRCSIDQARLGARQCVINALGAIQSIDGRLDHLTGVLRVGAFIASDSTFTQQPQIANAASELLVDLFGPPGQHTRAAVGANVLPLDASVEIEFIFQLTEGT